MENTASRATIQSFLFDQGIDVAVALVSTPDDLYEFWSRVWIFNGFVPAFEKFKRQMKMVYEEGTSDCDYFCLGAKFFANYLHTIGDHAPGAKLAFAEFYYQPFDGEVEHGINAPITRNSDGLLEFVFFEPQNSTLSVLSRKEITSCSAILF